MSEIAIELRLASEQYEQLATVARAQQRSVVDVVQSALGEWLAHQSHMERARSLMRELGQGLAQGPDDGSVARDHDAYLYAREPG